MNVGLTKRLLHHSFLEADCLDAGVAYSCRCRFCRISSATANTSNIIEKVLIYKSCKKSNNYAGSNGYGEGATTTV